MIDDLPGIDLYEAAIRYDVQIQDRNANWVHKYVSDEDVLLFASTQVHRYLT